MSLKLLDYDGNEVFPTVKNVYRTTSQAMSLGAGGTGNCVFVMTNPASSGKTLYITKLQVISTFEGTAAASYVDLRFIRATGTSASGSQTVTGTQIISKASSQPAAVATFRLGPTAITGMTSASTFSIFDVLIGHAAGSCNTTDLVCINHDDYLKNALQIDQNTSLKADLLTASVAGTVVVINIEWIEA